MKGKIFQLMKADFLLIFFMAAFFPISVWAQDIPKYGVFELTLTAKGNYSDPYLQMPGDDTTHGFVVGTFNGPNGEAISIDGFWDGGRKWKIRMAPTALGTWTYLTSSSDPGLKGKSGSFNCVPSKSKGFLRVDPDYPHHWAFEDGTRLYLNPASEFNVHAYFDMRDGSFQTYIDTRVAQGFNSTHFWGMVLSKWGFKSRRQINEGGPPFVHWDIDRINPKYWQWADKRVAYANSKGFILSFGIGWPDQEIFSTYTHTQLKRMWRYIIARYGAYNIIYTLFGEIEEAGSTWRRIAKDYGSLTKKFDPYNHPITTHTLKSTVASGIGNDAWLDFNSQQTRDLSQVTSDYNAVDKPLINLEFYYEDLDTGKTAQGGLPLSELRKMAWNIEMRGAYTMYEVRGIRDSSDVDKMYSEGAQYFMHLSNFFINKSFWKLEPNQALVNRGICRAEIGKVYVVYLDTGGSVTVDLSHASGTLSVEWYNPRTGESKPAGSITRGSRSFTAPDRNDWVLHIKEEASDFISHAPHQQSQSYRYTRRMKKNNV